MPKSQESMPNSKLHATRRYIIAFDWDDTLAGSVNDYPHHELFKEAKTFFQNVLNCDLFEVVIISAGAKKQNIIGTLEREKVTGLDNANIYTTDSVKGLLDNEVFSALESGSSKSENLSEFFQLLQTKFNNSTYDKADVLEYIRINRGIQPESKESLILIDDNEKYIERPKQLGFGTLQVSLHKHKATPIEGFFNVYASILIDLLKYIDRREKEPNYKTTFFGINFGKSKSQKIDAAKALVKCVQSFDVQKSLKDTSIGIELSKDQIESLSQGELGKIADRLPVKLIPLKKDTLVP